MPAEVNGEFARPTYLKRGCACVFIKTSLKGMLGYGQGSVTETEEMLIIRIER
jgi:hypothetical protein